MVIKDLTGRTLSISKADSAEKLDFNLNLESGIYFVIVEGENGRFNSEFIVE